MCGIVAVIATITHKYENYFEDILNGLKMLQHRGSDAIGIGSIIDNTFIISKSIGDDKFSKMNNNKNFYNKKNFDAKIIIGHTRWSTHGINNEINAHPHVDMYNSYMVVHNGIIYNYDELKYMLMQAGYIFYSSTDTEIIPNLIHYCRKNVHTNYDAIKQAIQMLCGVWSLFILFKDEPDTLYGTSHIIPLVLGMNYDKTLYMFGSESCCFSDIVDQYIVPNDGEIIQLTTSGDSPTSKMTTATSTTSNFIPANSLVTPIHIQPE